MTDHLPTVHEAVLAVMKDVQAVGKTGVNRDQHYNFRGVDAVVNAVGPAMRQHNLLVLPGAETVEVERYQTKSQTIMKNATVRCTWTVRGPAGDEFKITTFGEAADSGDKAVTKAQSVAWRVALIQLFAIPTDEPDPDEQHYERADYGSGQPRNGNRQQGRQSRAQGQQQPKGNQEPSPISRAREAVIQAAHRVRPQLNPDQLNSWIAEQLKTRNLKSDVLGDLRELADDLSKQDVWAEQPAPAKEGEQK